MSINWNNLKSLLTNYSEDYNLFKDDLRINLRPHNLLVDDSSWQPPSWIRIYFPEFPSPRRGIFIDYLFGRNQDVYLTLIQGVKGSNTQELEHVRQTVQQKIGSGSFLKVNGNGFLPVNYSGGMIFYKKYSINSFPNDLQLNVDLQEMIEIYKKVIELKLPEFNMWPC